MLISIATYKTCEFPGGDRDPLSPSEFAHDLYRFFPFLQDPYSRLLRGRNSCQLPRIHIVMVFLIC